MHTSLRVGTLAVVLATLAGCGGTGAGQAPVATFSGPAVQSAAITQAPTGEIVVRFKAGVRDLSGTHLGVKLSRMIPALNAATYFLQPGFTLAATLRDLAKDPTVRYAEANLRMHTDGRPATADELPAAQPSAAGDPNDPMFGDQYGMHLIQAPLAWTKTRGAGVTIAIADTGIDMTHPDLAAKVLPGYATPDSHPTLDPPYKDDAGHGTHCAGIAAAITDNNVGVAGVAPDAQLLPVKVCESSGYCWTSAVAEGVTWAADHGANVISLSLSSDDDNHTPQQIVIDAVNYALSKNVSVVVAMGNDGTEVRNIPAIVPGVIAVGATNSRDGLAGFSTTGSWISVSAPGVGILSTLPVDQGSYGSMSGTSMATPHVAGLAALVRAANPTATQADIKKIIESSADDKGPKGFDNKFGWGRINAARAVGAIK